MRGCHGLRFSAFLLALLLPEGPLAYKNSHGTSITFSCTSGVALTRGNNDFIDKFLFAHNCFFEEFDFAWLYH